MSSLKGRFSCLFFGSDNIFFHLGPQHFHCLPFFLLFTNNLPAFVRPGKNNSSSINVHQRSTFPKHSTFDPRHRTAALIGGFRGIQLRADSEIYELAIPYWWRRGCEAREIFAARAENIFRFSGRHATSRARVIYMETPSVPFTWKTAHRLTIVQR